MATESFRVSTVIPTSAERLYKAWLDSREHSAFTGGPATIEAGVGGRFTAWDGYITGTNLELAPGRRIVQAWRTDQFSAEDPDSRLEITFEPAENGTRLILDHLNVPIGQGYEQGWMDHYFTPMRAYFGTAVADTGETPAGRRAVAKKTPAVKKKGAAKKGSVKKGGAKKGGAKKGSVKKGGAKKGSVKKGSAKKSSAKKGGAKKGSVKKGGAKKGSVKKGSAKKSSAKKSSVRKPAKRAKPAAKRAKARKKR